LEQEKAAGKTGQLANRLVNVDAVILDELGYLPFAESGGVLLFHLISKLCKCTSLLLTTNLDFRLRDHRDRKRLLPLQTEDEISQLTLVNFGR